MKKPIRNSDEAPDWPDEEWEDLSEFLRQLEQAEESYNNLDNEGEFQ